MFRNRCLLVAMAVAFACAISFAAAGVNAQAPTAKGKPLGHHLVVGKAIDFSIRSVQDGKWSDAKTWKPPRVPGANDRVLIDRDTEVSYDVQSDKVIRLLQIVGTLRFARNRDTELNVGVLKVQASDECSESGFACDFEGVNLAGEPQGPRAGDLATLEIGTRENPIPAEHTARIRLHYLEGMDKNDAPAVVCCSARMELHGAPLSRTWVELGQDVKPNNTTVVLSEPVTGWQVGDEVIVTGSKPGPGSGSLRKNPDQATTEERLITKIDGTTLTLDQPLKHEHYGSGDFRSEVANLSRNVVIESADPAGVRGHTLYHAYSRGGISYARFAHLGKEGVLGRYSTHFHLLGDSMRGSQVLGAAIVDSHNRWVTIHGTDYLVVRDCVGYQSVGHGFFMEDGSEVYNLLDRNLGVQAYRGRTLPKQVLPFDPNEGAAFWWANGRNTLVRNVACENEEYGFRYDMQNTRSFNSTIPVRMPDGSSKEVDVRTIGIWRFEDNESHTEGLYGLVVAANGNQQPDSPIDDQKSLDYFRTGLDWTGPDTKHPHIIRRMTIWESHYAFRPHSPSMLMEDIVIDRAAYGIYRPVFANQVFRNLTITHVGAEPFNRGMDDASAQLGTITVDGLTFVSGYGNSSTPLIQISDNNLSGDAATHLRNVVVHRPDQFRDRWPLANRGVGPRAKPVSEHGVPIYIHDHYGPGRHAKIISNKALDLLKDGSEYRSEPPLTGDESLVAEVKDVAWPELLDPIDDLPPATVITQVANLGDRLQVRGISHDNGKITAIRVNGQPAKFVSEASGIIDWQIEVPPPADGRILATAQDDSGNVEQTGHQVAVAK